MELNNTNLQNLNTYSQNPYDTAKNKESKGQADLPDDVQQTINESAVSVNISMNAQTVLFQMNSVDLTKNNTLLQSNLSESHRDVLSFLGGDDALNGLDLKDLGYEGKSILELNQEEAQALISEDGFFGVTQTSDRVANFVFSFAGSDLELLEKGKEGIIQGFKEAEELFGGNLPEISYETQERTLNLLNERIDAIKNGEFKNEGETQES